jgi:hypothetical protein
VGGLIILNEAQRFGCSVGSVAVAVIESGPDLPLMLRRVKGEVMDIDNIIELLVREAIAAAVKKNLDRLHAVFSEIGDDGTVAAATELIRAVCVRVVLDAFHGQHPSYAQIDSLAGDIAFEEGWARVRKNDIATLLNDAFSDEEQTYRRLPTDDEEVVLPFIVAANLLAENSEPGAGDWVEYLDRVESVIVATRRPVGPPRPAAVASPHARRG